MNKSTAIPSTTNTVRRPHYNGRAVSISRQILRASLLLLLATLLSCGGGGVTTNPDEPWWPPVDPRQPERLTLVAPNVTDPYEWWRLNLYEQVPTGIYQDEEQRVLADEVVTATNEVRAEYGLAPVVRMTLLDRVAQAHGRDQGIRDYWWHQTPEGLWSRDRIAAAGVGTVSAGGENQTCAPSYWTNAAEIVRGWENHEGHRELLLSTEVKYIGVGVYRYDSKSRRYFTQLLVDLE